MGWLSRFLFRGREKKKERLRKHRRSDRPDSLPAVRKRALTLPLPPSSNTSGSANPAQSGSGQQRTCDQQLSTFFTKLPHDIRYLIYREVLAPEDSPELHVASVDRRLLSLHCVDGTPGLPGWKHPCWGHCFKKDGTMALGPNTGIYGPEEDLSPYPIRMGLLCSCRLIYSESINILYSQNVLNFYQTRTFVDLQRSILPQRLDSICSLHLSFQLELHWFGDLMESGDEIYPERMEAGDGIYPLDVPHYWQSAWKIIAGIKSLHSLRVSFCEHRMGVEQDALVHLLKPMTAISVPKYEVELYWPAEVDELVRALGNAVPFEIHVRETP